MDPKYAVLIQCQIAKTDAVACLYECIYNRDEMFKDYPPSTKYIALLVEDAVARYSRQTRTLHEKLAKAEGLSKMKLLSTWHPAW